MAPADHSSSPRKQCTDCASTVRRLPRNAGRALIWIYRHTLSPLVGYNCRHLPTCSVYGDEAIERFGLWGGGWMTLARILRCQPLGHIRHRQCAAHHTCRVRDGICRGATDAGAASTAHDAHADAWNSGSPSALIGLPREETNYALENQDHGHDRLNDLLAILALLILIVARGNISARAEPPAKRPSSYRKRRW